MRREVQPGESPDVIRTQAERVGIDDRRLRQHSRATLTSARKPRAIMTDATGESERARGCPGDVDVSEPASRLAHRLVLKSVTGGDVSSLEVIQRPGRRIIHEYRGADIARHMEPAQTDREFRDRLHATVGAQIRAANVLGIANRARHSLPARLQPSDLVL